MVNNYVIDCPTFYPTMAEMEGSFEAYLSKIEKKFAHIGLAKIVPPDGWTARKAGYQSRSLPDFEIPRPIRQIGTGKRGLYRTLLIEQKGMTLKGGFEQMATDPLNSPPKGADPETLERKFWQLITLKPPLYGADVPGSLFDENLKVSCRTTCLLHKHAAI
jgi:jumonji domain-containing protein 2